jgi:hypothetical protein
MHAVATPRLIAYPNEEEVNRDTATKKEKLQKRLLFHANLI